MAKKAAPVSVEASQAKDLPSAGWLPAPGSVPVVPEKTLPLSTATKQSLLKVSSEQRAEVDQAMEQLWSKRDQLAVDLGSLAPKAEAGSALHARQLEARAANDSAQALAAYTSDQKMLADDGVVAYLNGVIGDIQHMAKKNPQLAARYDKVLAVSIQRGDAISEGIARKKAEKADAPKG